MFVTESAIGIFDVFTSAIYFSGLNLDTISLQRILNAVVPDKVNYCASLILTTRLSVYVSTT